ncbi:MULTISPECIES: hypothetical protein [Xanthomonas]|uniref:hypothetical protein n=1 Tax=Xanthomonas TaxID=338 RepID=UPI001ADA755D|nr:MULTISPECIES: hypothetical protein [unclassified Xanthomonas]MBO9872829.1 hypothetical protein [Xanthomonas sp. D-93]WNH44949.1 hypothetical protein PG878_00250 [Xanthomonas sp. A6251]
MQRRIHAFGAATILACVAGFMLFGYSPTPCACEMPWQLVYAASGLPFEHPYRAYDEEQLQHGLDRHLAGSVVVGSSDYFLDACKETAARHLRCVIVTQESLFRNSGYVIEMDTDADGRLERTYVTTYSAWR